MLNYLFNYNISIPFESTGMFILNGMLFSYAFYVFVKNEIWKMNNYAHMCPMIEDKYNKNILKYK